MLHNKQHKMIANDNIKKEPITTYRVPIIDIKSRKIDTIKIESEEYDEPTGWYESSES